MPAVIAQVINHVYKPGGSRQEIVIKARYYKMSHFMAQLLHIVLHCTRGPALGEQSPLNFVKLPIKQERDLPKRTPELLDIIDLL